MKYAVFQIDKSRQHYVNQMERVLTGHERVPTECVDGRDPEQLKKAQEKWPFPVNYPARVGQLGIWYTVLNAFEHAPIVTFEDDAILGQNFTGEFWFRTRHLPSDADFYSLFLPRDSDHMYNDSMAVAPNMTRVYQRYGGVSMMYTERGTQNILKLLERDGITGQYDDTLYAYAKAGELNGYCSKPSMTDLVYITGREFSIVQETDYYAAEH